MDRTELTLAVAAALLGTMLLGWVLRGAFRALDLGGDAGEVAHFAERLHRAEEAEARLKAVERDLTAELAEVRGELATCLRQLDAARAEADEIRAAYRRALGRG